jgi:hypothetical protein
MKDLQLMVYDSLQKRLYEFYNNITEKGILMVHVIGKDMKIYKDYEKQVKANPGQALITISQLICTSDCEAMITNTYKMMGTKESNNQDQPVSKYF